MAQAITRMQIIKPISFFADDEICSKCSDLDDKLRSLAAVSPFKKSNTSLEMLAANWLHENYSGDLTEAFSWSHLAKLSQAAPRSFADLRDRHDCLNDLEQKILDYKNRRITKQDICQIAGVAIGIPEQTIRSGNIYTDQDANGSRTMFIAPSAMNGQLRKLLSSINNHHGRYPISLQAIWLLAAFLSCHPFRDGNGRTARALFNLKLMKEGIGEQYFMPLSALNVASKGFFEICVRRIQLQDSMDMMVRYMDTTIEILSELY